MAAQLFGSCDELIWVNAAISAQDHASQAPDHTFGTEGANSEMAQSRTAPDAFSRLVRQILLVEKQRPMGDVAAEIGMNYASFYARVIGRVSFHPEEIAALLRAVPDRRLIDWMLCRTGYIAVERPSAEACGGDALATALKLTDHSLAALRALCHAEADSDGAQADILRQHLYEAERAIGALWLRLPYRKFGSEPAAPVLVDS
jgi:hypothetical protein